MASNARIVAAIDVGSNSVRLFTAKLNGGQIEAVDRGLETTRLIHGMENGMLTDEAIVRTARAIADFARRAREKGAQRVEAFGTSAMRDAANSARVSDRTEALCGLRVRVIAGEEEAALAFAGAAPTGRRGVIDIGGGSTEMIVGENGAPRAAASAPVGAVRLMDRLGDRDADALVQAAREIVEPFARKMDGEPVDVWMGVGGTITTLAAMDKGVDKYTPHAIENHPVTLSSAEAWLGRLCGMSAAERKGIVGLPERRADIIPCGVAVLVAVMRALGIDTVLACDHDNLEGYIRMNMTRN